MHSSDTQRKPVDVLVDELYDARDIVDETHQLATVDRVIETLKRIPGDVMNLPPARQAVIATRVGYTYILGPNGLQIWIPHTAQNRGPGEWLDFDKWFFQIDTYRTESGREALQAVKTHGLNGIGSSPGYFGPHLKHGLHARLFTQGEVDDAQGSYEISMSK